MAKKAARSAPAPFRVGHGYDIHRLKSGGKLMLAGIEVATNISPIAHSDGDVVLHALVDALFGAIGLGDIGEMFPNTDPRWKNSPSKIFVEAAMRNVVDKGWSVANVDVTILAERPKLKAFKPKMSKLISELVDAPVNIKAGTHEGCDAVGSGKAIAAHVVVLLTGRNLSQ